MSIIIIVCVIATMLLEKKIIIFTYFYLLFLYVKNADACDCIRFFIPIQYEQLNIILLCVYINTCFHIQMCASVLSKITDIIIYEAKYII